MRRDCGRPHPAAMLGTGSVKVYELTADLLNKISKKK